MRLSVFWSRLNLTLALLAMVPTASWAKAAEPPALVVAISIDQFRYDYLERFRSHFTAGGFNLLMERGANFVDCHYRHSHTKTGCGHAVMLTGVHANVHGIIGNEWLDRNTFEKISCVGDPDVQVVGLPPSAAPRLPGIDNPYLGRSPKNLLVTTVGDELKLARGGRPKVIGISNKNRAAILMSGKFADAAYFMENGRMITSTYYMPTLPAWAEAWNAAGKADAYFGKIWERLLPEADYAVQGPDDAPGEDDKTYLLGRTLPKTVTGGDKVPGRAYYDAFENTPFSNDVLLDFTQAAIENEQLGRRAGITDVLCVSFSANDHIGHMYGPDSHEIMDNVVRMDRTLEAFFKFLDARIGLAKCVIVLTADHGVASTPERIHALNPAFPAGRIGGTQVSDACEAALNRAFGPLADKSRWTVRDDASILFFPSALEEKKVTPVAAQAVVRDALLALDFVQAAYTRDQLEKGEVNDELGRRALLSFNRQRSGDVYFQAKPYFVNKTIGANHGSPYNYDTHVPLLWFGVGVKPGIYAERVGVDDLAPTLAHLLGLPAPPFSDGKVLF